MAIDVFHEEWGFLNPAQRELHTAMMSETYQNLVWLGISISEPYTAFLSEQGTQRRVVQRQDLHRQRFCQRSMTGGVRTRPRKDWRLGLRAESAGENACLCSRRRAHMRVFTAGLCFRKSVQEETHRCEIVTKDAGGTRRDSEKASPSGPNPDGPSRPPERRWRRHECGKACGRRATLLSIRSAGGRP